VISYLKGKGIKNHLAKRRPRLRLNRLAGPMGIDEIGRKAPNKKGAGGRIHPKPATRSMGRTASTTPRHWKSHIGIS